LSFFFFYCSFAFVKEIERNEMRTKHYILGVLTLLCLLGTGYYAWTLYDAHCKQVAEWNEGAKAAFEEALWLEVNKRAEEAIYSSSSGESGITTLKERVPDSVSVMTIEGWKKYKVDREKYEHSLIKETRKRDRNSTFEPQFIKKRETILAEGVADRIIGLYAMGNSTREISDWMEENLGNRVSADTISSILVVCR
jgi:hypothetical protein